jgi:gamma-glutamyltranspeptidase/glutathione hydrolase
VRGAVAAGHPLTAAAGADAIRAGGSVVDAIVAAAFAAFVTEGALTGPGGGGFLLHRAASGEALVLDAFFAVPTGTRPPMDEILIDFEDASTQTFHVGPGAVAVPGLVPGLAAAHARFGRLAWERLVEPAIRLARAGIEPNEAQRFLHRILVPILHREEGGRRVYGAADRVETADLVPVLEALRSHGAAALPQLLPGLAGDLARYRPTVSRPLDACYGGARVLTVPSPSLGGEVVCEAMRRLDAARGDLEGLPRALARAYEAPTSLARLTGTTHVSALDGEGNAAALSMTLGAGSGVFRHGFQLNNMLGELDVIGSLPHDAGARLPSMMAPTIAVERDRPRLVLGSAGSVRLAAAIAQVAARVLDGEPVRAAVEAPRVYPDGATLHVEAGWSEEVVSAWARSWEVVRWTGRNLFFGGVAAAEALPGGDLAAAGDPRRGGAGEVIR